MATLGSVMMRKEVTRRDGLMAATEQKALWPDEINIKPQTAKSTATQESEHQLSRASEPEIQLRRRELDTATAYASDVRMMEVPLPPDHVNTGPDWSDDRSPHDQIRTVVSSDVAVDHGTEMDHNYHAPPFNATPFPFPTSSVPLWNHARTVLGQPNYFQQMMRKHYPWDEQVPSFVTGESESEPDDYEDEEEGEAEAYEEEEEEEAEERRKDEPFFLRKHDQVVEVEQLLSEFSVQLTACKFWEDEDALDELRMLLRIARDQVWMMPQPQLGNRDV